MHCLRTGAVLIMAACAGSAAAAPIALQSVFAFRDIRSNNALGITAGDRLSYGVWATPNPSTFDNGTTVTAFQAGVTRNVTYLDSPASPNEYFDSIPYSPSLVGSWQMTIANPGSGNSQLVVQTPTVLRPDGSIAGSPGFLQDMTMSGSGTNLTFTFHAPPGSQHDRVTVRIFDKAPHVNGAPQLIHVNYNLPANATSYTIPAVLNAAGHTLQLDRPYVVSIELDERRADGSLLAKSRSIFEFTPNSGAIPTVVLPMVDPTGLYTFNANVLAGQVQFYDPLVAIGYDYAIGAGDPNFASVLLPMVGDGVFDLYLFDGASYVFNRHLLAGEQFFFGSGVDRFRILGIETSAGLDPANATAFITGLSFVADGMFTGSMRPITASVPEPAAAALFVAGLLGLAATRRRGATGTAPAP